MKKEREILLISIIIFFSIIFFVQATNITNINNSTENINKPNIEKDKEFSKNIEKDYVKKFVEKKGINKTDIKNISKVDFNKLPPNMNIQKVKENNIDIYQVDYEEPKIKKPKNIFVITHSSSELDSRDDIIAIKDIRKNLNFGYIGEASGSKFLTTSTGVQTSLNKGYVVMRKGSITGISTNLDIIDYGNKGIIEIIVYINGKRTYFENQIIADSNKAKIDFDIQSKNIIKFAPGDIISVELKTQDNIAWKDVITTLELTTN